MGRWRGRAVGLAIIALAAGSAVAADAPGQSWQLVVRGASDEVLLRLPLQTARFTLRYRHSVYGSVAEERFAIGQDGTLWLAELAADEAAVLGEYYEVAGRPRAAGPADPRRWRAAPATPLTLEELALAATEHGRRTLLVEGNQPIPLWRLVGAGPPTVTLEAEPAG